MIQMVDTVAKRLAIALRIAGSFSAQNKYFYGLQVVVLGFNGFNFA